MKLLLSILIPASVILLGTACKKNVHPLYDPSRPYVNVWIGANPSPPLNMDSVVYNFSFKPDRPVDSVLFTARLMGLQTGKPFSFALRAVDGDTTKIREGVHYRFGNYTIGSDKYTVILPIYILRTKDFADTSFSILFGVSDKGELKTGTKELSRIKVILRDVFTKPDNWDAASAPYARLSSYFGTFSKIKFQFITNSTGVSPVYKVRSSGIPSPPDEIYPTQARDYSNTSKAALAAYNASHSTPLTDENGIAITF